MNDASPAAAESADRWRQTLGEIGLFHFAPYLMNRIMGRYNSELQTELKEREITTVKMRTLAILAVVPGLTINELSVYAVTEQSTMSRTLDALDKAGLVQRLLRKTDGRVREIYLTEAGRAQFDEAWPAMHDLYEQMFAGIPEDERAAFVGTLQRMLRNVRKHEI